MKNRKILHILIPTVVIIWGAILYKVIDYFRGDQITSLMEYKNKLKTRHELKKETYSLLASNPDPFGLYDHQAISSGKGKKTMKPEINWPEVRFYGVLIAEKKKNSVASLRINDCTVVLKTGDTCQGIRLSKISESSVFLRYKGEKKMVSLEQDKNRK